MQALSRKRLNRKEIANLYEMEKMAERAQMEIIKAQAKTKILQAETKTLRAERETIEERNEKERTIWLLKEKVFALLRDDRKISLRGAFGR